MSDEKLGRFGHHPDPAIDFCVEVDDLVAEEYNLRVGFGDIDRDAFHKRVDHAMDFIVGGDEFAVRAKTELRAIEQRLRP